MYFSLNLKCLSSILRFFSSGVPCAHAQVLALGLQGGLCEEGSGMPHMGHRWSQGAPVVPPQPPNPGKQVLERPKAAVAEQE